MRILQLTSDWKWTGPAAPMVAARRRAARGGSRGRARVRTAPPESEPRCARARARRFAPVLELERARGVHPLRDRADAARCAR
jgi:hypothetical protein